MAKSRFISWFLQAEYDYKCGLDMLKAGHYAQACFIAQQAAEKALKALAFFRGADLVKSHSLQTICKDLNINGSLESKAKSLDLFYLTTRYPDALPENAIPSESFDKTMAENALEYASNFISSVQQEIKL